MDRLFLDANVLFPAAYRTDSELVGMWELPDVELVTSDCAVEDARRNLPQTDQQQRLQQLLQHVAVWDTLTAESSLSTSVELPEKDRPILWAAVEVGATHLITGDFHHFGRYYGQSIAGVVVLPPGMYLRLRS